MVLPKQEKTRTKIKICIKSKPGVAVAEIDALTFSLEEPFGGHHRMQNHQAKMFSWEKT